METNQMPFFVGRDEKVIYISYIKDEPKLIIKSDPYKGVEIPSVEGYLDCLKIVEGEYEGEKTKSLQVQLTSITNNEKLTLRLSTSFSSFSSSDIINYLSDPALDILEKIKIKPYDSTDTKKGKTYKRTAVYQKGNVLKRTLEIPKITTETYKGKTIIIDDEKNAYLENAIKTINNKLGKTNNNVNSSNQNNFENSLKDLDGIKTEKQITKSESLPPSDGEDGSDDLPF
jgi:hypothetical protein